MTVEIGDYQIRPYPNGLCWEIWHYRRVVPRKGGEPRNEWVSEGIYPGTLGAALRIVWERRMKEGDEAVGLAEAVERFEAAQAELMALAAKPDGR